MGEPTMRDVLDQLTTQRDQLATMHATVQQQGAELARYRQRRQRGRTARRSLPLLLAGLLVTLLPLSLLAANPTFSDLNDAAEVHRPNIQAIGNAGITTGFADPSNPNARLYNPKGLVTREEMASFLARTAGLGGNAPVVNAKTAQTADQAANAGHALTADSATTATNAASAGNAAQLGGQPASAYTRSASLVTHEGTVNGAGTFPVTEQRFVATGTRGLLYISGSAYRANAGYLRIDVLVSPVAEIVGNGTASYVYTNEGNSHKALIAGMAVVTLTPGAEYHFIITRDPLTLTNDGDTIRYLLLELP